MCIDLHTVVPSGEALVSSTFGVLTTRKTIAARAP